jgi:hypothetical protein
MLRFVLALRVFGKLYTAYLFNFPFFWGGGAVSHGIPQTLNHWIRGHECTLTFPLPIPTHQYFQLIVLSSPHPNWSYQLTRHLNNKLKINNLTKTFESDQNLENNQVQSRQTEGPNCAYRRRRWRNVRRTFVSSVTSCEHVAVSRSKDFVSLRSLTTNLYNSASNRFRHLLY